MTKSATRDEITTDAYVVLGRVTIDPRASKQLAGYGDVALVDKL